MEGEAVKIDLLHTELCKLLQLRLGACQLDRCWALANAPDRI